MHNKSLLVSIFIAFFVTASYAAIGVATLEKDAADCYLISNAQELYDFAQLVNEGESPICGKLTADIVVNENVMKSENVPNAGPFVSWKPIGSENNPFFGTFDGQGHSVSGIYLRDIKVAGLGFFSHVGNPSQGNVTIKNFHLKDSYISGLHRTGGMVSSAVGDLIISNSSFDGMVQSDRGAAGGLVATASKSIIIDACYNAGYIEAGQFLGGLVGNSYGPLTMINSFNKGRVVARDATSLVGGLVGDLNSHGVIENSFNVGPVVGDMFMGSLVGEYERANLEVKNSFYIESGTSEYGLMATQYAFENGSVASLLHQYKSESVQGSIWGQDVAAYGIPDYSGVVVGERVSENKAVFHLADGSVFETVYVEGVEKDLPTKIEDKSIYAWYEDDGMIYERVEKISAFSVGPLDYYGKVADLNMENGCYAIHSVDELYVFAAMVNNGENTICGFLAENIRVNDSYRPWIPIGVERGVPFAGSFDGRGHTIAGLFCESEDYERACGLIGFVSGDGKIEISNIGLEDSYFTGGYYVGGIVGAAISANQLKVENSFSTASVECRNQTAGIVGNIEDSFVIIRNSYNAGLVNGYEGSAGLASRVLNSSLSITNSHNAGELVGYDPQGLVGMNVYESQVVVEHSFFINDYVDAFGIAASKEDFQNGLVAQTLHNYQNAEIDGSVWGQNIPGEMYPTLSGSVQNVEFPAQDAQGCYEIASEQDLRTFAFLVNSGEFNACGKLVADINMNMQRARSSWTPIGSSRDYPFSGIFDGQKHSINNLNVEMPDEFQGIVGLFGVVNDGTIKNLSVNGAYIRGGVNASGLVGMAMGVTSISNCHFDGVIVSELGSAGGLVGVVLDGTLDVRNCSTAGGINGLEYTGGLVGQTYGAVNIVESYNESSLGLADESHVHVTGGLVGGCYYDSNIDVYNSYNAGELLAEGIVGGLIGDGLNAHIKIHNSFNIGLIGGYSAPAAKVSYVVGNAYPEMVFVDNVFVLDGFENYEATVVSPEEFENGSVASLLHDWTGFETDGSVWIQGSSYPVLGEKTLKNIVIGWRSLSDKIVLRDLGADENTEVTLDLDKAFFVKGEILTEKLTAEQVKAHLNDTLLPISGVSLADDGNTAVLSGRSYVLGIPEDIPVKKVVLEDVLFKDWFASVTLPFDADVSKMDSKFYELDTIVENDGKWVALISQVDEIKAHMPYMVVPDGDTLVFEQPIVLKATGTKANEIRKGEWVYRGVYDMVYWDENVAELGRGYSVNWESREVYPGSFSLVNEQCGTNVMQAYLLHDESSDPVLKYIEIHFQEKDSSGDEEDPQVVGKRVAVPQTFKSYRLFDLKGRNLKQKPSVKGNFFRK